jgi:hypothetical protein
VCGGGGRALNSHKHIVAASSFTRELAGGQDFGIVSMFIYYSLNCAIMMKYETVKPREEL